MTERMADAPEPVAPSRDSPALRRMAEVEALSGIGSWEWEIAGDRLDWSEQLRRIYGATDAGPQLTYEDFISRVHPDDRERVEGVVRRAFETGSSFVIDHRIVHPDGTVRSIHSRGYVLMGDDGRPERMLGSAQDVTDARAAEEMRAAEERRRAAEQARDDALALIAHDLRSPLAVVLGYVQLMSRQAAGGGLDLDRVLSYLGRIEAASQQMAALIEDLLADAAVDEAAEPLELTPTDLVPRLRDLVAHHEETSDAHTVVADLPSAPVVVAAHLPKLERALHNLLVNAIKYSPDGGTVTLRLAAEPMAVRISVADQGIGIPEADLPLIFERFHRGSNVAGQTSGLGLGLTSVKRAVDAHGGRLLVDSGEGTGTTFTIELPLSR